MNDIEDVFVKRGVKENVQVASKDIKSDEGNKQGANFRGKTAKQKLLEKLLKSYEKPGIESKSAEKENRDLGGGVCKIKKNMEHILRQYHFSFPINKGIIRINAGEKN